jgi:hypothetical protein
MNDNNDSNNNDSSNIDKPVRVHNYSYSYNLPAVNKYMVLSVVIGICCLFVIGFVALVTTEVQNNKPHMKQYSKQMGFQYF